jgi:hypothetical protein
MDRKEFLDKIVKLYEISLKQVGRAKAKAESSESSKEELAEEIQLMVKTVTALEASSRSLLKETIQMMDIAVKNFEIGKSSIKANQKMADALSFYANEENWKSAGRKKSAASLDGGERARVTLSNDPDSSDK